MSQVETQSWRGIAAEEAVEVSKGLSLLLRRRSRALLADLLRPHRRTVAAIGLLVLTGNLAGLAGPWLIGIAIDRVPALIRTHDSVPIIIVVAGFCVAIGVQATATATFISMLGRMGSRVVRELRRRVFLHFQWLSVAFHERYTTGKVISRQVADMDSLSELFDEGLDSLLNAAFSLVFVGTGMLLLDWPLALAVMAGFVPLAWLSAWFQRESAVAYRQTRETIALVIVQFVETFNGIRAVQAFRRESRNDQIFGELNQGYADAALKSMRLVAIYFPGVTLIGNLAVGAVLLSGGLDEAPSVPEPRTAVALPDQPPSAGPGRQLELASVRFGYRDTVVLPGLNLTIPAGQTVALVGATGAGKTTIARLLARFYDPDEGRVLLDGADLRDLADADLRREVILITQENFLFSATIAENIELGRPGAYRAEVEAAAQAVGAGDFIAKLPDGYDTSVGKRGGRLSAGQRQLVSFARVFLAAPSVLILDEATSLLDLPGDRVVQRALQTVLAGRTAVIIAHRLSTVRIADRVLVLGHGQLTEDGSPADLLASGGEYSDLHDSCLRSLA